jgi:hypothetical protein
MKDGLYLKATNDHVVSLEIITTQVEFNPYDCFFFKVFAVQNRILAGCEEGRKVNQSTDETNGFKGILKTSPVVKMFLVLIVLK